MRRILSIAACLTLLAAPAFANIKVVATLPWIGSLARELGKDKIDLTVLVKPSEDPHFIEAKPSMVLAVRKADLLLFNGLDLEIGYLPVLIETSKNPAVQPGRNGNFDCSRFVTVIEKPTSVDRSMGDVHPLGHPHYWYSPRNIAKVAAGMAEGFARVDPANGEFYRKNLAAFEARLKDKEKEWAAAPLKGRRYIAYHKDFEYLAAQYGFSIIGYVENKPGIPPSAAHVEDILQMMKESKPNGILTTAYHGRKEVEFLSGKTGVRAIVLPHDVGAEGTKDWLSMMDAILSLLK